VSENAIAEITGGVQENEEQFEVWPENWDTVQFFMRLGTQWRYNTAGHATGLNYPSVESMLRILKIKNKAEMMGGLQIMERAVLETLNRE
jgi:hypothetical protein